jgi:hypothetical protein
LGVRRRRHQPGRGRRVAPPSPLVFTVAFFRVPGHGAAPTGAAATAWLDVGGEDGSLDPEAGGAGESRDPVLVATVVEVRCVWGGSGRPEALGAP